MLSLILLSTITTLLGVVNAACDYGTSQFPRQANVPIPKFSYDTLTGPLNWFELNTTANILCADGTDQSPILLNTTNAVSNNGTTSIRIPSYPNGALLENLGTNIEVVVNGTLIYGGKNYSLAQFHFHTPSEHRIDDQYFPMEAHFVFQAADLTMAVVGFLIELGTGDPLLTSVFAPVASISTPGNTTVTDPLDFTSLQSHFTNNTVYRYTGSLTTPPCSEGVTWIMSSAPLLIDANRYVDVKRVMRFNSRYLQNALGMKNLLANAAGELDGGNGTNSIG